MSAVLGLEFSEIDKLLNFWCNAGRKTLIYFQIGPTSADLGDAKVLELAAAARADFIVTFNKRHFPDAERFAVKLLTPFEFLTEIGGVE